MAIIHDDRVQLDEYLNVIIVVYYL